MAGNLLIDDYPLMLLPKLAVKVGLNEAVVMQQIHFLINLPEGGRIMDDRKWIWNTHKQWHEKYFKWWSISTIKRTFESLEKMGAVISCQPDGRMSRKKYYRIGDGFVALMSKDSTPNANPELANIAAELAAPDEIKMTPSEWLNLTPSEEIKMTPSLTETTQKITHKLPEGFGNW